MSSGLMPTAWRRPTARARTAGSRVDVGVAEPDPRVEDDDPVGMDDREGEDDPGSTRQRAAVGVHEVGDERWLDPTVGRDGMVRW